MSDTFCVIGEFAQLRPALLQSKRCRRTVYLSSLPVVRMGTPIATAICIQRAEQCIAFSDEDSGQILLHRQRDQIYRLRGYGRMVVAVIATIVTYLRATVRHGVQ